MLENIKLLIRQHSNELAIFGIMTIVSVLIATAATGDFYQAVEAGRRR